ncbi:flagellar outer dynein arm light chain 2 [Micromonas pusilla CCMP1545]|uniref:Flagellar outer dynein arm light chain 2 n=1 Tax=Micromonas pusilla (strain CCMP1545) TaxID=564608 RepID=C1MUD2_MICPC|nr:flagellar outer dynein arm light chain 2 [Micromonas pusilla CCMP1545]EEH56305.1 flagellar outer dynein arm light chain 2 [Micromonas pusilla CCMP1545]|mmetsp:Transcript_12522/g.45029  ORF Transcript_12522/g.45029 Transcript_12522/m.45029 type:complete len:135 (-) Transcript_12522:722-1126(-)|eukprot:XP_003059173.1 flagellar outer dynein arm light chain 2 [Micromonas pusilla CCMP1545]
MSDDGFPDVDTVKYENTYIMKPEDYGEGYKFMRGPVQKVLSETIKERLHDTTYDPLKSAQIAKELADTIKERVKNLNFTRYKLVVQVTVGEKTGQAIRLASRCLWDTATDNFASDFYENSSVFCVAMVFGLYYE